MQWTYGHLTGDESDQWALKHFSKPRPIYNLHQAMQEGGKQLIVVEGEKCAEEARKILGQQVVITWPGGAQAAKYVDWSPLGERERLEAFLWPDADDPGRQAMGVVGESLFMLGYTIKVIEADGKPAGWDVADLLEEGGNPLAFMRDHARSWLPASSVVVIPEEDTRPEPPPDESVPELGRMTIGDWMDLGLVLNNSKPVANISNVSILLGHIKTGEIWYDEFLQKIMTRGGNGQPREWCDADDIRCTIEIQRRCGMASAHKMIVRDAIIEHAYKDTRNEVQGYLRGLVWDGVTRIDDFFIEVCGTPASDYAKCVGRNFFVSMVARAMKPGCQVDTMIVLEGKQGIFKSSLLKAIGGQWYTVMRDAPDSKDFGIVLQGKWLIEIAEMDSFSRADVKATKRTLTTAIDRYRKPYGVHAEDFPRVSVFAGSTNRDDWLNDDTGARRFYPIECAQINLWQAKLYRDQYFAEAMALYEAGENWHDVPEAEAEAIRTARYSEDTWHDLVSGYCDTKARVTTPGILEYIGLEVEKHDRSSQMRVSSILRVLKWKKAKPGWDGFKTVRYWVREDETS